MTVHDWTRATAGTFHDFHLGWITHLKERDVWRNTMMVVTSDHGEEFLEHGSWEHQKTLYEEVVRIPLIVAGPEVKARRESR